MRVFIFVALFAFSAFAQEDKVRAFEQYVEAAMKAQQMPGLSVAVMHGDFRWSRGFGFADLENQVPARAESSYRMGSVSKPFTAVAVLKLVEEGKIDLDAEVQTYVPYFPKKSKPVTVRQLLAHQGGISHYRDYNKEGRIREPKNTREALAIFQDFDLVNEPGTAFSYSSYGYNLLGAVIEGASGKSYGDYLTENVWKPLGMTATRMDDPRALVPHRVTGYVLENGQLQRSEYIDISSRFGGGGTRSTVDDMIRFIDGIAAGKVLKNDTRNAAWTMQPTRDGRFTRYGLGFGILVRNGRWIVAHTGAQQETRTNLVIVPAERFAFAVASNFEDADLSVFEDKLLELFLGDPRPVAARANDDATQTTWRAMNEAFNHGLAYYERHGKAMTTDKRELAKAFAYFKRAQNDAALAADGAQPLSGEPLTKIGSYMASVLAAKNTDLDVFHREGALRFFDAFLSNGNQRDHFDQAFARRVAAWQREWNGLWTPELQNLDLSTAAGLAVLERNRELLAKAALAPDFSRQVVSLAERAAQRRDLATAMRAANLGYELYPRAAGTNGILGVFALLTGDPARAKSLLATSLAIDPRDYARADNLINIVNFLDRGLTKEAAGTLRRIAAELHPNDVRFREK
ncbi:MAG TPA: serine hydrolase [Thermoanaerobaculia bacterium]|nr:serine hydrolase [Thermoanaerobaculia bacterium]